MPIVILLDGTIITCEELEEGIYPGSLWLFKPKPIPIDSWPKDAAHYIHKSTVLSHSLFTWQPYSFWYQDYPANYPFPKEPR